MKPWVERTHEEAHLLNPAFCCATITASFAGYRESRDQSFPFVIAFMVLPIILHKDTRESLPNSTRTSMPAWLQDHAQAKLGFYGRLMALQPYTREAITYGLAFGWVEIGNLGKIQCVTTDAQINRTIQSLDGDAHDCVSRARFLGRWFGKMASTETILALWGIRP